MTIVEARKRFAASPAAEFAARVSPFVRPFAASTPLSKTCNFFADRETFVVVVADHEKAVDVDKALAYGLAWCGDRDLVLVLPVARVEPTLRRAAFLDAPIRVFTHGAVWREQPIPAVSAVLDLFSDPLVVAVHSLGTTTTWVDALQDWANKNPDLRPSHRPSYLAWHCHGRMVLKIVRAHGGLRLTAGVHSGLAVSPFAPLVQLNINGPLLPAELTRLCDAASQAIADRLSGLDTGHREHLLQARLSDHKDLLGLVRVEREFPCVRPGGDRAYIDLLGVDPNGDLHIVETKIGDDVMLVMQGLDYYAWAQAHLAELSDFFDLTSPTIFLDFVVASRTTGGPAVGAYTESQAEVIDGAIRWRFTTVTGWADPLTTPSVDLLAARVVPAGADAATAKVAPRYRRRLHAHQAAQLYGKLNHNGVTVNSLDDHLLPGAHEAWHALATAHKLHNWAHHMRSSQAFALNLFAPLQEAAIADLLATVFGPMASAQRAVFEYEDELDELRESPVKKHHRTQIDVLLRGITAGGQPVGLALEVKLTETNFGTCSAATSPANDTPHVCTQDGPWGGEPASCFQLRNHGGPVRRLYDEHVIPPDPTLDTSISPGCWYRTSASQPMRNVALGDVIKHREHADVRFALCAPGANEAIWRRWSEARQVLPDDATLDLPAEHVLAHHSAPDTDWLRARYLLGDVRRHDLAENVEWLTWKIVASLTAHGGPPYRVVETHPGGGQYDCIALCPTPGSPSPQLQLNRVGSAHFFWPDGSYTRVPDVWQCGARHGPTVAADDLAAIAAMPPRTKPSTPFWEGLADSAATEITEHRDAHWRSGISDDGYADRLRRALFEAAGIPIGDLGTDSEAVERNAESHWFLVQNEQPIAHAHKAANPLLGSAAATP